MTAADVLHGHTDWPDLSGIPFNYKCQCIDGAFVRRVGRAIESTAAGPAMR